MLTQCRVDRRLIIAATRRVNLCLEPFQKIVIETNSYACLSFRYRYDGTPFLFQKIVFFSHGFVS